MRMLTVYVLKNGVGRYNIFFFIFYTKLAKSSFLCRFRVESVNVFVLARVDLSTFSSSTNQGEHTKIEYQYVRNLDKREVIVRLVDVGGIQVRLKGIQAVRI
jgi:hypothetical protein